MNRRLDRVLFVAGTIVLVGSLWLVWVGSGNDERRAAREATTATEPGTPASPFDTPAPPASEPAPSEIETAARKLLAGELDVDEGSLRLASSEEVGWSDASLGCPQEGMAYAQVLTPGHRLVFDLADTSFAVHANADGSHMVICGDR